MCSVMRNHAGFTLLELMVAACVLAITLFGLFAVLTECSSSLVRTSHADIAADAIRSKLEKMRAHEFDTLFTDYGVSGSPGNEFSVHDIPPPSPPVPGIVGGYGLITIEMTPPPASADLLLVTIRVRWGSSQGDREIFARSYIADRENE